MEPAKKVKIKTVNSVTNKMSDRNYEQRINIKFCVKLEKTPSETYEMLKKVYGDSCISKASVVEWHRKFRKGREHVMDNARTGRPTRRSQEVIDKVIAMLQSNQNLSNEQIAKHLTISRETVRRIKLHDLNMEKINVNKVKVENS